MSDFSIILEGVRIEFQSNDDIYALVKLFNAEVDAIRIGNISMRRLTDSGNNGFKLHVWNLDARSCKMIELSCATNILAKILSIAAVELDGLYVYTPNRVCTAKYEICNGFAKWVVSIGRWNFGIHPDGKYVYFYDPECTKWRVVDSNVRQILGKAHFIKDYYIETEDGRHVKITFNSAAPEWTTIEGDVIVK